MALFRCELAAGYKSDWLLLKFQPVCGGGYKKKSIVFLISNEEKYKLCYGLQKKVPEIVMTCCLLAHRETRLGVNMKKHTYSILCGNAEVKNADISGGGMA